ncbi:MAG: arylsulfatase [Actinobacteria bacterium]|nr:arylsulfatase [Actinomycetota bacterium]
MSDKPNIVFILCDNTGWGDFSCYGGLTPTPRIDKLAGEGVRLRNYTVEAQCTPTRSAIMTGRQSVRSGTYKVPLPGQGKGGLAPWEYTIGNLLSDAGYATSLWGKWHLGDDDSRLPTEQGFDEWWGYRNSADECGWTSYAIFDALAKEHGIEPPKLWEGKKGGKQTAVRELDLEVRPLLDELITEKATDYIKRSAKGDKPFFTYVALSHVHPPEESHPDFHQTDPNRNLEYSDVIAEMDYRVGQILDSIEDAGIADNTVVVFSSDNAAGEIPAMLGGSNGPFRGSFFTPPSEGSMRTPAMVRWPGKVPSDVVTDEPLTAHDWYKTFAQLAGASDKVPTDRPLDGVDASEFLLGKSETSGRQSVIFFGPDGELMSVKFKNWKMWLRYSEGVDKPIVQPQFPLIFDLGADPNERYNIFSDRLDMGFVFGIMMKPIVEYELSTVEYPNIKPGEEFDGYKGAAHVADEAKAKLADHKYHTGRPG